MTSLARHALRAAMQLRRSLSIPREAAVNAFDIAQMVGIDVRFMDAPSLEGMFVRDPGPRILLPSTKHRPKPRIAFSCAHEIGHQQFDHGTKADRYWEDGRRQEGFDPVEYLVNSFAGHLLMPRGAVVEAFARRGWSAESPTPPQAFCVAGQLGVGYATLVTHLNVVLEVLSTKRKDELLNASPKAIKSDLMGEPWPTPLIVVDAEWRDVPIDLEAGEVVILPAGGSMLCELLVPYDGAADGRHFVAAKPGVAELNLTSTAVPIRVARRHYIGPLANRYLSDPDEH